MKFRAFPVVWEETQSHRDNPKYAKLWAEFDALRALYDERTALASRLLADALAFKQLEEDDASNELSADAWDCYSNASHFADCAASLLHTIELKLEEHLAAEVPDTSDGFLSDSISMREIEQQWQELDKVNAEFFSDETAAEMTEEEFEAMRQAALEQHALEMMGDERPR